MCPSTCSTLAFEEQLGLMVDREAIERENKRLASRLKFAGLRQNAAVEDVDMKAPRGLDKALFAKLVSGDWINQIQNLIIVRPCGVEKSRNDRSVLYHRVPRLFDALALARGDGRHARLLKSIGRVELLILDDWGLANLTPDRGRDLLEIADDRNGRGSTIITSQLPVEHWHETSGNPTIADAILDRVVHNAHRLTLKGESLRKAAAKLVALYVKTGVRPYETVDGSRCPRSAQCCPPSNGIAVRLAAITGNRNWREQLAPHHRQEPLQQ